MSALPRPLAKPRALLVDIDNTLYEYEPCHRAGLKAAADAAAGLAESWHEADDFLLAFHRARVAVKRRLGRCAAAHSRLLYFKEMVEAAFGHTKFDAATDLENAYWSAYGQRMTAEPDALALLEHLSASGTRLAWLSNYTTARQIWKLRLLGLDTCRAALVTSEEAGAEKPDPAVVDLALARLGIAPGEAWFVGDSVEEDMPAARARKIFCILLDRNGNGTGANGGEFHARDWREIRRLFES